MLSIEKKFKKNFPNGLVNIQMFMYDTSCSSYKKLEEFNLAYYVFAKKYNFRLNWSKHLEKIFGSTKCFSYNLYGERRHCYKFVSHNGKFSSSINFGKNYGLCVEIDESANCEEASQIMHEITNKIFKGD